MDIELRTKLNEYCKSKKWDIDDDNICEILFESKSIKEYDHDEHRWYTCYSKVVQIDDIGVFIDFQDMTSTGDEPGYDEDDRKEEAIRTAVEVFPKEVTITDYVTADKL